KPFAQRIQKRGKVRVVGRGKQRYKRFAHRNVLVMLVDALGEIQILRHAPSLEPAHESPMPLAASASPVRCAWATVRNTSGTVRARALRSSPRARAASAVSRERS